MPSQTFYKLKEEKRQRIALVLKNEFENHPFYEANVKRIVEGAEIPRGSFYQYFEDLYDAYFLVLKEYTVDMHLLFVELMKKNHGDLQTTLFEYGDAIADEIFDKGSYSLYKNYTLYLTYDLEQREGTYRKGPSDSGALKTLAENDQMAFLRAVVHDLMQRMFTNNWSKNIFVEKYKMYVEWIIGGIKI